MTYEWHQVNRRARCRVPGAVLTVAQKPGVPRWLWSMTPDVDAERARSGDRATWSAAQEAAELAYAAWRNV